MQMSYLVTSSDSLRSYLSSAETASVSPLAPISVGTSTGGMLANVSALLMMSPLPTVPVIFTFSAISSTAFSITS